MRGAAGKMNSLRNCRFVGRRGGCSVPDDGRQEKDKASDDRPFDILVFSRVKTQEWRDDQDSHEERKKIEGRNDRVVRVKREDLRGPNVVEKVEQGALNGDNEDCDGEVPAVAEELAGKSTIGK
jgi:hypothetical protein